MLIRLLQNFESITLALDEQPPEARPPVEWSKTDDRRRMEKIRPKNHLTTYAQVCTSYNFFEDDFFLTRALGRFVDTND